MFRAGSSEGIGSMSADAACRAPAPSPRPLTRGSAMASSPGTFARAATDSVVNLDDTDVSGVNVALYNLFPSNLTAGNWKVGLVIDDGASDEQASALERIFK